MLFALKKTKKRRKFDHLINYKSLCIISSEVKLWL
nr:MAG TPA: hypothetical protein [Caudoviricetes sp.]